MSEAHEIEAVNTNLAWIVTHDGRPITKSDGDPLVFYRYIDAQRWIEELGQ